MLDDFFTRAIIAGIGVAAIVGPLGCFIVWRRMAYFGDTLSHSALLGVAMGFLLNLNLILGVFVIAATISMLLILLQKRGALSTDAVLGILSHASLALGIVIVSTMTRLRIDLMSLLFGDILSVSHTDIAFVYGGGAFVLGLVIWLWRPLLVATVNEDLARAEGFKPDHTRIIFMLLMAAVIAVAMKIVGVLLVTALLIIPAAAARQLTRTPESMAVVASIIGAISVVGGLFGSLEYDTPSGPSIVVAAMILFLATLTPVIRRLRHALPPESPPANTS